MNRRSFLKNTGATVLGPLLRIGGGLAVSSQLATASETFQDYKALVVVFLDGGNDAMNMFIPTDPDRHSEYEAIRGADNMAVSNVDLDGGNLEVDSNGHYIKNADTPHPYYDEPQDRDGFSDSAQRSYVKGSYHLKNSDGNFSGMGMNGMMPELAAMYKSGKVSVVSNIGTLVRPTTKEEIDNGTAELPVFLFAHNHQKRAVYTTQAEQLATVGWAGKIADDWKMNEPVGLNITYGDITTLQIGEATSPLKMSNLDIPPSFKSVQMDIKGDRFETILDDFNEIVGDNAFANYYGRNIKRAGELSTLLTDSMATAPDFATFTAKNSYGMPLFSFEKDESEEVFTEEVLGIVMHDDVRDRIFRDFRATARMIKVGKETLNYTRQIFYVRMTGFDFHSSQATNQLNNLRSLSLALSDFQKALEEMGLDDKVLTVSLSDFGRTLKNNSDGTDHGWGGHSFMMSGDSTFQGGNVLGTVLDDLTLEGKNCYTKKGRIIPTTSIEQMLAPALKWFGVSDALLPTILPNLSNFQTGDTMESAFLQGVFSSN